MQPSEPVTIVLSQMGWVRSAKGHDIDAQGLSYKAGDSWKASAKGKSNQPVVFIDTTGRSYAIDPITLPSARGQGEPLTGKLTLPPGATVEHMLMESDDRKLLMASDAGYGFVCTFNDLVARNRAGKALITLPDNAHVMPPLVIEDESDMLLAITAAGRMLMFPVSDLPQLSKGKGNKIISIPAAEAAAGQGWPGASVYPATAEHAHHPCWQTENQTASGRAAKSHRRAWSPRFADAWAAEDRPC